MEREEPEQVTVVRGNQNEEFSFLLYEFLTRDVVRENGIHILCFFFFGTLIVLSCWFGRVLGSIN